MAVITPDVFFDFRERRVEGPVGDPSCGRQWLTPGVRTLIEVHG